MSTETAATTGATTTDTGAATGAADTTSTATEQTGQAATAADGTSTAAEGTTDAAKPAAPVVPESYADFKVPEGVALGAVDADVKALAKELGLGQESAQKVVDVAAKLVQSSAADQLATVKALHADWQAQTKADPAIGTPEKLAEAKAAMEATATPQLRALLEGSGLANHPDVVRHFLKIGPAFTADKFVPGGRRPAGSEKTAAQVLYPEKAAA